MTVGQTVLAPGEATEVTVAKTVRVSGPYMETITLHTNDPANPVVYLTLHADIPYDLVIRPDRVYVPCVRGESPTERLQLIGPEAVALTSATTRDSSFTITLSPADAAGEGQRAWDVTLTTSPALPIGTTEDELRIETTYAGRPLVTVPVTIDVQPQIRRLPPKLFFGFIEPGETETRTLALSSFDGRAFRVKGATTGAQDVTAQCEQTAPGRWRVHVAVKRAEAGIVGTTLVVTTNLPGEERIEVPLYADVRPAP